MKLISFLGTDCSLNQVEMFPRKVRLVLFGWISHTTRCRNLQSYRSRTFVALIVSCYNTSQFVIVLCGVVLSFLSLATGKNEVNLTGVLKFLSHLLC